jgi:hypothetical protein
MPVHPGSKKGADLAPVLLVSMKILKSEGDIFKVVDTKLSKIVAVKMEKNEGVNSTLKKEFGILSQLSEKKVPVVP